MAVPAHWKQGFGTPQLQSCRVWIIKSPFANQTCKVACHSKPALVVLNLKVPPKSSYPARLNGAIVLALNIAESDIATRWTLPGTLCWPGRVHPQVECRGAWCGSCEGQCRWYGGQLYHTNPTGVEFGGRAGEGKMKQGISWRDRGKGMVKGRWRMGWGIEGEEYGRWMKLEHE